MLRQDDFAAVAVEGDEKGQGLAGSVSGMASIIPNPGSPPAVAPLTTTISTNGNGYTIAAGTQIYATTIETIVSGFNDLAVNNGTVWLENTLGHAWFFGGGQSQVVNNGFIYIRGDLQAELTPQTTSLVNTGSIFVVSNTGWARGVKSGVYPSSVDNSGTIAVQSLGMNPDYNNIWNATAIEVAATNTGIINRAGGKILAEAPNLAIGIEYDGQGFFEGPAITNAGLIQAHATADDGTSVGIFMAQPGYVPQIIINSGTIIADIAIYATSSADTVVNPVEQVVNQAGGVIEGLVYLDIGDDRFQNDGTVTGDVDMGPGADVYLGSGSVSGVVDMGFDDDSYTGSSGSDRAAGGRGDDVMNGGGGNDLLLGGFGADTLEGGAGNDGLIGEWGNDTIRTAGGDWVEGGAGNDRVVLGDLSFRSATGGDGFDTLVLPGTNLVLDLASALATGRLHSFEVIELHDSQRVVVRAGDAAKLTEIDALRFDAGSTGGVTLVGSWTEQATTVIGSHTYRVFTLGDETIRVQQGAGVTIAGTAPGDAVGLDPIAGGDAAPRPGTAAGLDYTPQETFLSNFPLTANFTVDNQEIFYSDGSAVFTSQSHVTLTNNGAIYSLGDGFPSSRGIDLHAPATVVNHGLISIEQNAPLGSVFYYPSFALVWGGTVSDNVLENDGTIQVYSVPGSAIAVSSVGVIRNSGLIQAISENSRAIAVNGVTGSDLGDQSQSFFNTGTIYAEAGGVGAQNYTEGDRFVPADYAATGAALYGSVVNAGDIIAALGPNAAAGLTTEGIYVMYPYGPVTRYGVTNSGHIKGTIAIEFAAPSDGGTYDNYVVNTGVIDGDIRFSGGNDDFDGRTGVLHGAVYGFGGNDTMRGGADSDSFYGGEGNDVLDGGGGNDRLEGGRGNDTYYVDRQDDLVFENAGQGTDTVITTASYYLYANIENLTLAPGAGDLFGVGNERANVITGNEGGNTLLAGVGDDTVHGGAGVDILYGEDGADQLFGDADNDVIVGGAGNDAIDGGTGGDLLYGEDGNDTLTGGTDFVFDQLVGGAGDDILHGDSGLGDFDYLIGNAGNDSYYVDTYADLVFENAGEGTDTVYASTAAGSGYYLYANIENLVLAGSTFYGVGNELANRMTGSALDNWLLGGAGNDILNGKAGNDVLFGQDGADTFVFEHGTGGDTIADFTAGTDKIDLSAFGFTSFAQVQAAMSETGGSSAIVLGGGDLIVLQNVTNASLHAGDFILSGGSAAQVEQLVHADPADDTGFTASRGDLIHQFDMPWLMASAGDLMNYAGHP